MIGRRCDELGLRELAILEAAHSIVAQAIVPQERRVELLEFADAHFAHLISEAVTTRSRRGPTPDHTLLPTGYEHALHAIGHELDRRRGDCVTIIELDQCLLVRGHQPTEGNRQSEHSRFEWVLAAEELTALLDAA